MTNTANTIISIVLNHKNTSQYTFKIKRSITYNFQTNTQSQKYFSFLHWCPSLILQLNMVVLNHKNIFAVRSTATIMDQQGLHKSCVFSDLNNNHGVISGFWIYNALNVESINSLDIHVHNFHLFLKKKATFILLIWNATMYFSSSNLNLLNLSLKLSYVHQLIF